MQRFLGNYALLQLSASGFYASIRIDEREHLFFSALLPVTLEGVVAVSTVVALLHALVAAPAHALSFLQQC